MPASGPSRHFDALRNLVATGGIADDAVLDARRNAQAVTACHHPLIAFAGPLGLTENRGGPRHRTTSAFFEFSFFEFCFNYAAQMFGLISPITRVV